MSIPLDVRYGLRKLNNNVGFTAVAVACLALGICASVTVFSVVDSVLIRPLPGVVDQSRIVSLATKASLVVEGEALRLPVSYQTFLRYKEANHVFSDLAAFSPLPANLAGAGEPVRVQAEIVTDNYFSTLGLRSSLGRFFTSGRGKRDAQPEAVISHALWRRLFGGRRQALGSVVRLNGQPFIVIGVGPERFRGTVLNAPADLWVPMDAAPLVHARLGASPNPWNEEWLYFFFGRLRPGLTVEQTQTELDLLASRFGQGLPAEQRPQGLSVHTDLGVWPGTRNMVAGPLAVLSGLVGMLMLIVCANLGGLLLVKAAGRQEEIGVRLALGVTRGQLVRQLLTESVALSLLGGLAGFMMALFAMDVLRGWALGQFLPTLDHLAVDLRVVVFALAVSVGAGILFGLMPALWSTRRQVVPLLHRGSASSGPDRARVRLQETLVVAQVTLSLMLLVSTGLFVRTLQNLQSVDSGFDSRNLLNLGIDLSLQRYPKAAGSAFYDQLLEQVRKLPQVNGAALALFVPLASGDDLRPVGTLRPLGPAAARELQMEYNAVSPGFFRTLGIPLYRGRDFSSRDREGSARVLIVDELLAKRLWQGRDPLGEQVSLDGENGRDTWTVIGVVGKVHSMKLTGPPKPSFYVPLAQRYSSVVSLQVRTSGDLARAVEPVRAVVRKLDPNLAVRISFHEDEMDRALSQPRLFSWLLGAFSLTALLVTALGLYGTLSYAVSRRTRELGIRMALGARDSEIVTMVLRRGLGLTLTGLILGILAAVWATSIFSGLLFGVEPTDPGVFVTVTLLLALVGLAASSLPAYRATRVDPMAIIRHE